MQTIEKNDNIQQYECPKASISSDYVGGTLPGSRNSLCEGGHTGYRTPIYQYEYNVPGTWSGRKQAPCK